jgi:hypothetical protein
MRRGWFRLGGGGWGVFRGDGGGGGLVGDGEVGLGVHHGLGFGHLVRVGLLHAGFAIVCVWCRESAFAFFFCDLLC